MFHRHTEPVLTLSDVERCAAITGAAMLVASSVFRRPPTRWLFRLAAAPLAYRGVTGRWPTLPHQRGRDTRAVLGGAGGVSVRESIQVDRPVDEVYRFWRRLENLPRFMGHLERVEERSASRSHWVASGPAGVAVEWDAEIINEIDNQLIAWRSLPGSDVTMAGSVNFDRTDGGANTLVSVHLQYAAPAGRAGSWLAALVGRDPARTIREDLQRLKHALEAGENMHGNMPDHPGVM